MSEQTVCQKLFYNRYLCRVPNIFFHRKEELEEVGMLSSGNKDIDRALVHQRRDVYLSPVQMVLLSSEGAPIQLANPREAVEIYQNLKQHLDNWRILTEQVLNAPEPPVDDLRKMDQFAASIYWIASQFTTEKLDASNSIFTRMSRRDISKMTRRHLTRDETPEAAPVADTGHSAVADRIARSVFIRRREQ